MRTVARLVFPLLLLMPSGAFAQSTLVKLGEASSGAASQVAIATLFDTRFVTATVSGNGSLEVAAWDVTRKGHFTRNPGAIENGAAGQLVAVSTGNAGLVTIFAAPNGTLRLLSWSVAPNGAVRRTGAIGAGAVARVSATAVGDRRIVTASQDSAGAGKLIVWDIDAAGAFTRRGDAAATAGTVVSVAAVSASLVATAIRNSSGKLEIAAYSLDAGGRLASLGAVEGDAVTEVAMAATARDRIVTASRLADGAVKIDAWTAGEGKPPVLAGSAKGAPAAGLRIAVLGGVKALTAGVKNDGTLSLASWQVSDQPSELDSAGNAPATGAALTTLGWDRAVTASIGKDGKLTLTDWGDAAIGLLHATWDAKSPLGGICGVRPPRRAAQIEPPTVVAEEVAVGDDDDDDDAVAPAAKGAVRAPPRPYRQPSTRIVRGGGYPAGGAFELAQAHVASPAPALKFEPDIRGVDPMIAVGEQYVVVSEDHWIEFVAKTGDQAGSQLPSKAGEPTCLTSSAFFAGFMRQLNPDGSSNRNRIDLYQRHPASSAPGQQCDLANAKLPPPCINEFYDTRVFYDPYRGRFVIQAAARGGTTYSDAGPPEHNLLARRYYAFAVSRTEDPRDGFEQWITTENNYSDWPRIAGGDGVLIAAHWACKGLDAVCGARETGNLTPLVARTERPMANVYNMDDLVAGKERPRNWKVEPDDVDGGGFVIPLAHRGPTNGWTYFIGQTRDNGGSVTLYGFRQGADWSKKPELRHATTKIKGGMSGFAEGATFQGGKLYFAGADRVAERTPNLAPARYMVRGVRIDVSTTAAGLALAACPGPGCLIYSFGAHDSDDAAGDLLSYEMPSMAVNKAGDMLVVHGRAPVMMAKQVGQEVRYRIFYHDARGLRDGALLHAGAGVLAAKFCAKQSFDTVATPENFIHIQYPDSVCPHQPQYQDYGTAVVDANGTDFWVAHAFAQSGAFKMAAGKVTP
jgi:hypothetical protein